MLDRVGFVVKYNKRIERPTGKTHVWTGNDTMCRMWSTGGLVKRYYYFYDNPPTDICQNCKNNPMFYTLTDEDLEVKDE